MYFQSLREQVAEMLREREWTYNDLADEMGVSKGRMSHIINGDSAARPDVLERLAAALDVEPSEFDVYVAHRLGDLAKSAPELVAVGRKLLNAKDRNAFARIASKISV